MRKPGSGQRPRPPGGGSAPRGRQRGGKQHGEGQHGGTQAGAKPSGGKPFTGRQQRGDQQQGDQRGQQRGAWQKAGKPRSGERASDRGEAREGERTPRQFTRTREDEARPERPRFRRDDRGPGERGSDRKPPRPLRPGQRGNERKPQRAAAEPERPGEPMRISKAMSRAGLCSRRDAERWIAEGRVAVNGKVLSSPALDVGPKDKVLIDGKPLPMAEPVRLFAFHKPSGLITAERDPAGRPTIYTALRNALPANAGRVMPVGRLDFNTEGLLLLTNDGALARHLELPATGWLRRYRVRAFGKVTQADLDKLKDGIEIEGVRYGPVEATLDSEQGANVWLTIGLREGKNREVRKILGTFALEVNRLIRVSYGPFQLLDLQPGKAEPVKRRVLADQLGSKLADELGLSGPNEEEAERRAARKQPKGEA